MLYSRGSIINAMQIFKESETKKIRKNAGTEISYHIFDEYEVNVNNVPPGVTQDWHYHKIKEEAILVISGCIDIEWKEDGQDNKQKLNPGDFVRVENSMHRFINPYQEMCVFVCIKLILDNIDKHSILAGDKYTE